MINHQGLMLYPLTPGVIATRPDLDPWQRQRYEQILHRGGGGWTDFWDGPWGVLSGSRGIAVVRDGRVVETFTTVMS